MDSQRSQSTIASQYDVVVIGGGPAGSTVSTVLAQRGCNVGLFERERFPRFHIGESLLPFSMDAFVNDIVIVLRVPRLNEKPRRPSSAIAASLRSDGEEYMV